MNKYKFISQIGEGSFATTWLATDEVGKEIVLKKYKPAGAAQARSEYIFLSALNNANVPAVIDYYTESETVWLAMEYITGKSPQPSDFTSQNDLDKFFFLLCNQIVTIQSAGICLNDIKPENIIIRHNEPWLLDLGLATTNNFYDGSFRGNIAYSSPEKIKYNVSHFACDLFALGILYCYLSQGQHPADKTGNENWQKLLLDEQAWTRWQSEQSLPEPVRSLLEYNPARRPSVVQTMQYFSSVSGLASQLRWSIIDDYLFPVQQDLVKNLFSQRLARCNPDDEPDKLINQIILHAEAAGKPAFIIKENDLINDPENILAQFSVFSEKPLNNLFDIADFPEDRGLIILVQNDLKSPFFRKLQTRSDTLTLLIDNNYPAQLIALPEFNSYIQSVGSQQINSADFRPLSIYASRLYLRALLLPATSPDHFRLPSLSAAIDYSLPLNLAELLETDWLQQITAALQNGFISISSNEFRVNPGDFQALPADTLAQYQKIASENNWHLYAALIAIVRNDLITALHEMTSQYRILTQKGFFVSAWQLITLLEQRIGYDNLDFTLRKAKAFLTRRLGDPALAIELYQQLDVQPATKEFAVIMSDLAIAFQENDQLDEAIAAYQKALDFFRTTGDTKSVLRCLNNMGAVYYQKNNYNQCSQIYLEVIRITENNDDKVYARNYHLIAEINLADISLHKAQWKRALNYARNAVSTAQHLDLEPYRHQAEIIAVTARFALGENDDLLLIIDQFLQDKSLPENPPLYQEIIANCLLILQFLDPAKARSLSSELLSSGFREFNDDLLLSLFFLFWQNRRSASLSAIPDLLTRQSYKDITLSLLDPTPDKILKHLQLLSRHDDSWLYIVYATQIATARLHLEDSRIAQEITNLLDIYSFQPLQKLLAAASSNTPEHLQLLWDVVSMIHNETAFPEIMTALLQGIIRIAKLDRAIFFAYQDGMLSPRQGIDQNLQPLQLDTVQVSQTILLETLENNEISFLTDLQEDTDFDIHSSIFGLGLRSAVCYPLRLQNAVHGVIYSDAKSDRVFNIEEKKLLNSILVQGSSAFEKALLIENIRREQLDKLIENDAEFDSTIIGNSPAMQKIYQLIKLVASHNVNVLITGDTGTGKELVARSIHKRYAPTKPFTPLNCAAIPETLLESELFGYVKGAFTGADRNKKGLIEATEGGTLFLDEIGDMPVALQAKLLRVIQERQLTPLGSSNIIPVDVRIIAATNRSLETAIENGSFRQDLYYRLKVIKIDLPSLSNRRQDIPHLVQYFITRYNERFGKNIQGITAPALELLQNKTYHGNVRELENDIERAMVLCQKNQLTLDLFEGSILPRNYSLEDNIPLNWEEYKIYRHQFSDNLDEIYAKKLLKAAKNKISTAATLAKISRTQLYRLLNRNE